MMDRAKPRTIFGVYIVVTSSLCLTCAYHTKFDDYHSVMLHRDRRSAEECKDKYKKVTSGHTACLPSSSRVMRRGVREEEKRLIVQLHNIARREVSPNATNMNILSWDNEIAYTAQRWAENCEFHHDKGYKRYAFGRFSVGQNLAKGTDMSWQGALGGWIKERQFFVYGGSNNFRAVGHYTQVVWADTVKVGCGYAYCDDSRPFHYYVCNYGPAGNFDINVPYSRGRTCADCPNHCNNGLCDCNGRFCLNGGTMDFDTCTCSCKKGLKFFLQPDCSLNCTAAKEEEPWYCKKQFVGKCEIFSNVPQECPDMCSWCPYSGKGYGDISTAAVMSYPSLASFILTTLACLYCLL